MAETPRYSTGGPITSVDVASIVPGSQTQELGAARQAAGFLAQTSQALVERGEKFARQAKEHFAAIDTTALELNRKSRAQDLILEATLKADEEIQSLLNTKGIEPLTLADRSEAILNRIANETVGQASSLGVEVRDFVRGKMNNLKINHIPGVRQTGYQRETDERLAALQRRNFHRKAELYKPGTSQERQLELLTDITEDIKAHEGIHLSAQDTRKMLEREQEEFFTNTFYETLSADPQAAWEMLNDPKISQDLPFDPRQKQNMMQQAENILQAEENRRRQRENDELRARNLRAEKVHSMITDDIILKNKDPREHFANPGVRDLLDGNQKQDLLSYYDSRMNAAKKNGNNALFLVYRTQLQSEPLKPEEAMRAIVQIQEAGANFTPDEMDKLLQANQSALEKKQTRIQTRFEQNKTKAEAKIKRNFSFEKGFISILEPDSQTELNFAVSGAIDLFNARADFAFEEAEKDNLDPLTAVDTGKIADEVMIQFLPDISRALSSQTLVTGAFRSLAGTDTMHLPRFKVAQELTARVQRGEMPEKEALIIMNLWTLNDRLANLTAGQTKATQQGVANTVQQAIQSKTGKK